MSDFASCQSHVELMMILLCKNINNDWVLQMKYIVCRVRKTHRITWVFQYYRMIPHTHIGSLWLIVSFWLSDRAARVVWPWGNSWRGPSFLVQVSSSTADSQDILLSLILHSFPLMHFGLIASYSLCLLDSLFESNTGETAFSVCLHLLSLTLGQLVTTCIGFDPSELQPPFWSFLPPWRYTAS